ncbi:MAG TPA: hypothetical protein VFF24_10165, partial [Acidimicrobiia bacterium]|nr:hypothetical protein [Acidimicrobiia bacterium]
PARTCAVIVHELAGRREEAIATLERIRATTVTIPFELRTDPELRELRARVRRLFRSPPPPPDPTPSNERTPSWPIPPSR